MASQQINREFIHERGIYRLSDINNDQPEVSLPV